MENRGYQSTAPTDDGTWGRRLETTGAVLLRYSLVTVLLWVGALKFTAYEADAVANFVENSPLLSWMLDIFSVRTFSGLLGALEITLALMIAARPVAPRISAIGSLGALGLFLVTLTFVFSTPGAWQPGYGIPFLSPDPGQFLAKDVAFAAIAVWSAGEALRAARQR
ncbi:MAG: DUF417 family protein [Acidimicrobiia bacterium]|nr:DUF417 family protein [Acidimicrobiia bacterium]